MVVQITVTPPPQDHLNFKMVFSLFSTAKSNVSYIHENEIHEKCHAAKNPRLTFLYQIVIETDSAAFPDF